MSAPARFAPCAALLLTLLVVHAAPTHAQEPAGDRRTGQIVVVAVDTLDGLLPGATVTVAPAGPDADTDAMPIDAVTGANGEVRLEDLPPGDYDVTVDMPGFDVFRQVVTVEAGQVARTRARLSLGGFAEQVAVVQDATPQQSTDGFTETLSAEEIDQLPDDPEELAMMLDELAGGESEFRVNGFAGGELPPKDQIQAIRIRQDPFSPDSMGAGQPRVEIVTKPGLNAWRHEINAGLRDQAIDARQPFAPERGQGQTRRLNWNFSGPLVTGRTSIAGRFSVRDAFDAQTIVATTTAGSVNDIVNTQRGRIDGEVRVEHALINTHTLRLEYQRRNFTGDNLGVGEFSLRERAFADERTVDVVRISETGTFGRSMFNEFRVEYIADRQAVASVSDAVAINVQNAFLAGGAQRTGGVRSREIEIANSLEFVPAQGHNARVGFEGEWGRMESDRFDNFTGTFTFASLEDFAAGRPRQFVQRTGNPLVEYSRYEFSWWAHDDWQVRDDIRLGIGIRHDFQGYLDDKLNIAPRLSVSWTPTESKRTSINAGVGVFNNWLGDNIYEQSLRLDGQRQRDLIVADPSFPDPFEMGAEGELPPPSVVRFGDNLVMQTSRRTSVGLEHRLTERMRVRINAFEQETSDRYRSLNVNAPVEGLLPNPDFARITEMRSVGRARSTGLDTSVRASTASGQSSGMVRYRYTRAFDDADGPLGLPADSNDLAAEWGPASYDVRHRIYGFVRMQLPLGVRANLSGSIMSGAPYTIRTGFDDNGDTIFNDRPDGLGRNTERGTWRRNVDLRLGWRPTFLGTPQTPPGQGGRGPRGGGQQARGAEVYGNISNLFNETNFTSFAGVRTSPLFGLPTGAASARRFEIGTRVFF